MTMLKDIKEALGIEENNLGFDEELLIFINAAASEQAQIGVSQFDSLEITEGTDWPTYDNNLIRNMSKPLMILSVKLIFDPPPSQTISTNFNTQKNIYFGRIAHELDEVESNV